MNPSSEVFGWAILAATFLGPIFAVLTTRYLDRRNELRTRRLYVFRTLMATRRAQLTAEHVAALNLIEIDFQGEIQVIAAWKNYFENLKVDPRDERKARQAYEDRPALLARLLHAIAKSMKYNIEQLDIMARGYLPQLAQDNTQRQYDLQTAALDVLSGKKPISVKTVE